MTTSTTGFNWREYDLQIQEFGTVQGDTFLGSRISKAEAEVL